MTGIGLERIKYNMKSSIRFYNYHFTESSIKIIISIWGVVSNLFYILYLMGCTPFSFLFNLLISGFINNEQIDKQLHKNNQNQHKQEVE